MTRRVLVVNAGSSSLKLDLVEDGIRLGGFDQLPTDVDVDAVGHRIVHGGADFVSPTLVDATVKRRLAKLAELAPLHQPKSLTALAAAQEIFPDVPHVACFDTAFHASMPREASTYALPGEWRHRWPIRRYGFHGLAHAWVSRRVRELVPGARRIVTCHLGAGASLAAVLDGRGIDTTMGFTPLDGLVMATRSGSLDPGLLTWLVRRPELSAETVDDALEHSSGLFGLTGTPDMQDVLRRDDADARLGLDVYLHRLAASIAGMVASLGGLDALAFSGGVGEHAPLVRARTAERIGFLGVQLSDDTNQRANPDAEISAPGSLIRTFVVAAREDLEVARLVTDLLRARLG